MLSLRGDPDQHQGESKNHIFITTSTWFFLSSSGGRWYHQHHITQCPQPWCKHLSVSTKSKTPTARVTSPSHWALHSCLLPNFSCPQHVTPERSRVGGGGRGGRGDSVVCLHWTQVSVVGSDLLESGQKKRREGV